MDPQTIEEWCGLAHQKRRAAELLLKDGQFEEAWLSAGFAVECALKAAIMKVHRFNSWPSREARRDLYVHDLTTLLALAGIAVDSLIEDAIATKLLVVLLWQRSDGYRTKMPGKVARDICAAAFSPDGVLPWISTRFQIPL